jgi:hypothetical protein
VPSEMHGVSPTDMIPPAASDLWNDIIPVHGITIIVGIRPSGREAVHVVHNSEAPVWVLIGLLDSVRHDLLNMWQDDNYVTADPQEEDDD